MSSTCLLLIQWILTEFLYIGDPVDVEYGVIQSIFSIHSAERINLLPRMENMKLGKKKS